MVLNTKTIDDVFNKDAYKEFNKNNKNIFQEAKNWKRNLRPKERENLRPKKTIAKRAKLRKQRLNEIKRKEQNINNELLKYYFTKYQSPSNIYKELINRESITNEFQINLTEAKLAKLKVIIENTPKKEEDKMKENNKVTDNV